jgi:hypothetical protein
MKYTHNKVTNTAKITNQVSLYMASITENYFPINKNRQTSSVTEKYGDSVIQTSFRELIDLVNTPLLSL